MASDYAPSQAETATFSSAIQNKLHFAADLHAAREYERFAEQRRARLEAEGEAFNLRTLEMAARVRQQVEKLVQPAKRRKAK